MSRTADGVEITVGLIAYDNNLDVVRITGEARNDPGTDPWFTTEYPLTGGRGHEMNGDRLSTTYRDYGCKVWKADPTFCNLRAQEEAG